MEENNNVYWVAGEDESPLEVEILRVKVAQNESPVSIATFIISGFFEGKVGAFNPFKEIEQHQINKIVPPPLWGEVANYLSYYLALAQFHEYTELQFLMVGSLVQSYGAVKTAQYCKQENITGAKDLLRLQNLSFPKATFSNCVELSKEIATTLYKGIVNFRSAMLGAREWIKEHKGANLFVPSNFEQHETTLKSFLPIWKEIFKDVDKLPYSRKERACFNFYKITPDNQVVITFAKSMLDNYYFAIKTTLLNL